MASLDPLGPGVQSAYVYTPLADAYTIRILTLQPGRDDEPLVGRLTTEDLAFEPAYEAISYVWGAHTRTSTLLLHAEDSSSGSDEAALPLPLTPSIHDALARLRLPDSPRRLWADQICINQSDIAERGQQVALMNTIYKNARHILIWLGRDDDGVADEAVRWVHHLRAVFEDEESHEEFRVAHSEDLAHQNEAPWTPLSKLTKLPWFNRLWIVQEVGTLTPATLFWGSASIDWEDLSIVANVLSEKYHLLRTRFAIYTPSIRYLYRRFVEPDGEWDEDQNRGSFVYELHRARHLLSKDARDRVYAFLGHFSITKGTDALAGLVPDYNRTIEDVYCDVAIRTLKDAKSLILLSATHTTQVKRRAQGRIRDTSPLLPSWVPDWRVLPLILLGSPETPHRAAGGTTPKLDIDEQRRILHVVGRRVNVLGQVSPTFYGREFQLGSRGSRRGGRLGMLWRDVCGFGPVVDLERRYMGAAEADGDEGSAFFAFVQTLTNGSTTMDKTRDYKSIPNAEWLANGAAYLARSQAEATGPSLPHTSSFGLSHTSSWASTTSNVSLSTSTASLSTITSVPDAENLQITPSVHALAQDGDAFKWSYGATLVTRYRRFGTTARGAFLIGPDTTQEGDTVAMLYGGRTPFVLRPREDGGWTLVGECYVHGMMGGEALEEEGEDETFSIY